MPSRPKSAKATPTKIANATDASSLFLVNQMCFAIYSTSLAMTKVYRPLLSQLGLTYPQYVVLLALWERDTLTVSALGGQVALDSGTLTPLLKRLQSQGLIERERGADDERQVYIRLTRQGHSLKKKAETIHDHIACATHCSSAERKALTRALQKLRSSLLANAANAAGTIRDSA